MNEDWLKSKVADVSSQGEAVAFVQGYPATGFARVTEASVDWRLSPDGGKFDAEYSFDVRLFGDEGEWHAWSLGSGKWGKRLALESAADWQEPRKRRFAVLGTKVDETDDGWTRVSEARGVRLWIPITVQNDRNLPMFVPLWERLAYDDQGLVYVADAMLRPLKGI